MAGEQSDGVTRTDEFIVSRCMLKELRTAVIAAMVTCEMNIGDMMS